MLQKACAARLSGIKQPYPNGQVPQTCSDWVGSFILVGVRGLEPRASCSQSRRATNCATPRYEIVVLPGRVLPKQARYQLRYTRLWNCFICGLSCGLGRFLTTGFAKLVPTSGSVPAGCEVGSFPSWMGGICSQTYREHFFSSFLAVFSAF